MEKTEIKLLCKGDEQAFGAAKLPCLFLPSQPLEVYDPQKHGAYTQPFKDLSLEGHAQHAGTRLKQLPLFFASRFIKDKILIPRPEDCYALWERYAMLDNVREHSKKVADLAFAIAAFAREQKFDIMPELALASGLLHDLGKTHSIEHGGDHAQIGAAWVMRETRNAVIARAVLYHVYWAWEDSLEYCTTHPDLLLVLLTIYADKRVRHDKYVSLDDRYVDLRERYGKTELAKQRIEIAYLQGKKIEQMLSGILGVKLDEYTVNSGRLVQRTGSGT